MVPRRDNGHATAALIPVIRFGWRRVPDLSSAMTDSEAALPFRSRPDHIFPTLTEAQIARVAAHGRMRRARAGEVLVEPGDRVLHFYVIGSGAVEVIRP